MTRQPSDQSRSAPVPANQEGRVDAGIQEWRREQRRRLVGIRDDIAATDRQPLDLAIAAGIDTVLASRPVQHLAVYWPLKGEPDLRNWCQVTARLGIALLLPVVVARQQPLIFRSWVVAEPLGRDALNIPCPASGPPVDPDAILSPCVGFDADCFRLGNGGGYYDRTLPLLPGRPLLLGVAYQQLLLPTIRPQAHDIPMDFVVTDKRIYSVGPGETQ